MNKDNIKIVLCRTWSPGNIGSIIRASKNFDMKSIHSVNQINFDQEETLTMAAGAKDHLKYLHNSNSAKDIIADCTKVYAFSNRKRKYYQQITPREMAEEIAGFTDSSKVGLLFGNETNGLNNEELDLADTIVTIPASDSYSSFNLAFAVMIALYEINIALNSYQNNDKNYIENKEKRELINLVSKVVCNQIIEKQVHIEQFQENVRFLFKKMLLTTKEAKFIKSIFKLVEKKIQAK